MSFSRPDFVISIRTPIFDSISYSIGRIEMTPIEPTMAIGTAMIFVAPAATMYAPEAPVPRTNAITGFFFAIFDTALNRYSDGPAAPPGESISMTSARILLFSSIARSIRMNSVVRAGEPIAPKSSVTAMRSGLRLSARASMGSPSVR